MINKIYKIINNKFSRFFKFVFFVRYLFLIFFVAIVFLLNIPYFFDYKKKEELIKIQILENYGLEIKKNENIKYISFPVPHLQIRNISSDFHSKSINLKTQQLKIYHKISSIYNFENFSIKKIRLENSTLETDKENIKFLIKNIVTSKKKIFLKNLNIIIKENKKNIIKIKKINFMNYGYKKNVIDGEVFNKKFNINLNDNFTKIDFKLFETGISSTLIILEKLKDTKFKGVFKGKILKSNFKLNFVFDENIIQIDDFFFRDKQFSSNNKGKIEFKPYFKITSFSEIKNINTNLFKKLDIDNLIQSKVFFKRINSQNKIIFKKKRFNRNLIDNFDMQLNLAYGRLNIAKKIQISGSNLSCKSNVNLLLEFPIVYFECLLNSPDRKKLLKKIKVNLKTKNEPLKIFINGNINILNKKVNFDKIKVDNNSILSEDLKYYKLNFENILFDEDFKNIFNLSKIRKFILEVS